MSKTDGGFSDAERAAVQQRAEELRSTKGLKGAAKMARELEACVAVIDGLEGVDKQIAVRLHAIVAEEAPDLNPKTMYGFPAYARDGKVVVFFHSAAKYGTRYNSLGFEEASHLDDGVMWPTSYAITGPLGAAEEKQIAQLVRKASGPAASTTVFTGSPPTGVTERCVTPASW